MAGVTLIQNAIVVIVLLVALITAIDRAGIKPVAGMLGAGAASIGIVFALAKAVLYFDPGLPERIQQNRAQFSSFCTELYGDDASVYAGGSYGDHAGLHCQGGPGEGVIHQGQIPESVWTAYVNGEVSAQYVTTQLEPVQGLFSIAFGQVLPTMLIIGMLVLVVGVLQRYRADPT